MVVDSLPPGSARYVVPDAQMTQQKRPVITAIGAVIVHDNGLIWHRFEKEKIWEHAVYHWMIRPNLISFARLHGQFGMNMRHELRKSSPIFQTFSRHLDV
ncbi:MAG: hypothetical protein Q9219_006235 [cf. Caloplaca sp. 3 TL-2023]